MNIQMENTGNSAVFAAVNNNITDRATTNASVNWQPQAWNVVNEVGERQRTPDLSNLLQEVVDRNDWASGNAISFIITGNGRRVADSHNGGFGPRLHIEYTLNNNNQGGRANNGDRDKMNKEFKAQSFKLYPNPVHDELIIRGINPDSEISIISMKGAILRTLKANGNSCKINVSDLKNGVYLIEYYIKNEPKVSRFIKK